MTAAGLTPPADLAASTEADADVSHDTLLRGRLSLVQPKRGYRFSLDPILLTAFVHPPYGRFIDVGTGCGVVGLLLLARDVAAHGVGVELQPRLAALAARNAAANGWAERLAIHGGNFLDWAPHQPPQSFDLVITNPPFYSVQGGHLSPNGEKALAHHEVGMSLLEWVAASARLLTPNGRLAAIFPSEREKELLQALLAHGLFPHRLRRARPTADRGYHRVLVEARRAVVGTIAPETELVVHENGGFSREVLLYLGGGG